MLCVFVILYVCGQSFSSQRAVASIRLTTPVSTRRGVSPLSTRTLPDPRERIVEHAQAHVSLLVVP